jgi:histidinol-phosphate/aromatic aminotransferase/cobyric acid decarboxylase-like protein
LSEFATYRIALATEQDREAIYRLRYTVYSQELGQHRENPEGRLVDTLDEFNEYLCVWVEEELVGFVSVTPPTPGGYSLDKYFGREELPFPCDDHLFEVRLLTVIPSERGSEVAFLLMYAALRFVVSRGGTRIAAIGRCEVLDLYSKVGLRSTGQRVHSGRVAFELIHASSFELVARSDQYAALLQRIEPLTDWQLDCDFRQPAACFHGGKFFESIGERFDHLHRADTIINADVLDAWFPPAPRVLESVQAHLPWLLSTSPPTAANGLVSVIAESRGVRPETILPGAGSSDLIFRALRHWLGRHSRALILDPTYGEYSHVLEKVIGCSVDRLKLDPSEGYEVCPDRLKTAIHSNYDLIVLVNPNSPTGRHLGREKLEPLLRNLPRRTRVWIDETYIEYVGSSESLESLAATTRGVVVCKSMSKVYALSGARVAYLCAAPQELEALRAVTPPWIVGLPAQVAAVEALQSRGYYEARWLETHSLRETLASNLRAFGWEVLPGCANFLLVQLPPCGMTSANLVARCQLAGLFLRDATSMSRQFGDRVVRIAVKDASTNARMIRILRQVLEENGARNVLTERQIRNSECPEALNQAESSPQVRQS